MPTIDLDQQTFEKLQVTAHLTDRPIGAVVKQLVDRLVSAPATVQVAAASTTVQASHSSTASVGHVQNAWLPVFKVYKGHRVEGEFNPSTMELKVTTAPWSGRVFQSPTAAAIAVVEHFPSDRETSNTNGRKFWKVTSTGRDLRSVVGER